MDPYDILGIPENATLEEIKKAYRREAMKWHPDRSGNSAAAKERFFQAAEAYKFLSENYTANRSGHSKHKSSGQYRDKDSTSGQSDNYSNSQYSKSYSGENFADTVFWDAMLDHAIKLAQSRMNERQIANRLVQNGCQEELAAIIADKAFNIHAHYAASSRRKRKQGNEKSSFKEERLEAELQRAFIGQRNLFLSPRDTIDYYLVVFSEFRQAARSNPFAIINTNKRLMRILNFSVLFLAIIAVAIVSFPIQSEYRLLPDATLLQIPLGILALMLVWTAYRKLWLLTFCFVPIYLASLIIFDAHALPALNNDYLSLLQIALICYAPFIFIAMFGNYFYYRKAQRIIRSADRLFGDHQDKIVWIRSSAGTSSAAVFVFASIIIASVIYLEPERAEILDSIDISFTDNRLRDNAVGEKIRQRLTKAGRFFEIAESHFNSSPPDYVKASMAYSTAADNGSLLAAYKLGYMHYVGAGVQQNDLLAIKYFELATRTPLAFQPHSLQLTTEFLAQSYNNLGIMYQNGYGARRNTKMASEMYRKAMQFGSKNAQRNLATVSTRSNERRSIKDPNYRQIETGQ